MRPSIQSKVTESWDMISTENLNELADYSSYKHEFLALFGFDLMGVDYDSDVDLVVPIDCLIEG